MRRSRRSSERLDWRLLSSLTQSWVPPSLGDDGEPAAVPTSARAEMASPEDTWPRGSPIVVRRVAGTPDWSAPTRRHAKASAMPASSSARREHQLVAAPQPRES